MRRPLRELRAFAKIHLEPGESTVVELELPRRAFAYWNVAVPGWVVAEGDYQVQVCADAHTVLESADIVLAGDRIAGELTLDAPLGDWFDHPDVGERTLDALGFSAVQVPEEHMAQVRSMTMRQLLRISGLEVPADTLEELMAASR